MIHFIMNFEFLAENDDEDDDIDGDNNKSTDKTDTANAEPTDIAHFDYTCDVCGIDQVTFEQTLLHYNHEHNQDGYIKCCGKKFSKEATVADHIKWHQMPDLFK